MAFEKGVLAIEFAAPGADIVGFEYVAKEPDDLAAVEAAKASLGAPLALFTPTPAAGCAVVKSDVVLIGEGGDHDHGEHDHGEHAHDDHGHEEHAHNDHGHEEHAHDDHGHEKHAHDDHGHEKHAHDDHGHEEHAHGEHAHDHDHDHGAHSEFRAEYQMTCETPDAFAGMSFPYFERFPNAEKLDVTVIGDAGAQRFEATRETPSIDLSGVL
ncbi:MAG: DUF2796 domain-containing protein [Pseudomonadota bacterium]